MFLPGGYGALGEATAWGFAQRGAYVAIAGPSSDKAEALASAIRAAGYQAEGMKLDARDPAAIARVTDDVAIASAGSTCWSTVSAFSASSHLPR